MTGKERVAGDREGKDWRVTGKERTGKERVAGDRDGKDWRVTGKERTGG